MKIKPNKSKPFYVLCIFFIFVLINSTIVLTISNNYQVAFSQGYIPPPSTSSNNIQSQSINCPQFAFSGPSYTGPDGCKRPCPTGGAVPQGCPQPGACSDCYPIGQTVGGGGTNTASDTLAKCKFRLLSAAVCKDVLPGGPEKGGDGFIADQTAGSRTK